MQGKDDYTHADDYRSANPDAKQYVDDLAKDNDVKTMQAKTNDQLLDYATAVFAAVAASKMISLIRTRLHAEAKETAHAGGNEWKPGEDDDWVDRMMSKSFDSTTWSDRIWSDMSGLRADLYKIMRKTILTHTNASDFRKEIVRAFDVSTYQADRILRTEGARVSGMRQQKELKESGYEKAEWVASADACPHCRSLDGDVFKLSELYEGKYTLPAHPNCRCSIAAYDDEEH